MNDAWMWYLAQDRQEALLREVADERLAREARRHAADGSRGPWVGVAGRLAGLWPRSGPLFLRASVQRSRVDGQWR